LREHQIFLSDCISTFVYQISYSDSAIEYIPELVGVVFDMSADFCTHTQYSDNIQEEQEVDLEQANIILESIIVFFDSLETYL